MHGNSISHLPRGIFEDLKELVHL